ncbi:tissue factor-like isoform X1 [Cottoperca gobio]|uniref:Tissue factor n=1 Tax=Cottoperca gobio TaxID=56716 RepID=A0A6J2RGX5_COTGO|nr:tissue factor-like isoform X1 [Cottoperca gobio]
MASLKTGLYLGVCLCAWIITTADDNGVPRAENVRWVSLDFKTILNWTTEASDHVFTVRYSSDDSDWTDSDDCIRVSESECDLTHTLKPLNRPYSADIITEPAIMDYDISLEMLTHEYSSVFNPYLESNISAVNIIVEALDESTVIVNITDPLTSVHHYDKQLSLRDILKKDLKYKITYYKSGSTGKRDIISDTNMAVLSQLDAGQSYCFMAAAFIPSRPKRTQHGAWSVHQCIPGGKNNPVGVESWSLGGCSLHPAHSPLHHRYGDGPLL